MLANVGKRVQSIPKIIHQYKTLCHKHRVNYPMAIIMQDFKMIRTNVKQNKMEDVDDIMKMMG